MMKRTIHQFAYVADPESLLVRWHRYKAAKALMQAGYTGQALLLPADAERLGALGIYQQAKGDLLRIAAQLVEEHDASTWAEMRVSGAEVWKIHVQWLDHGPDYAAGVRFDAELRWHRLRDGERLPAWCDGTLLYERGAGEEMSFYRVNTQKGRVVGDRVNGLARDIAALLAAVTPLVDALDKIAGWE
jgi:hypothetical protein